MRRFSVSSVFLGLLLAVWPTSAGAATFIPSDEAHVYQMVNATRADLGLGSLIRSAALDQVARGQSERMMNEQRLFHNPKLALDLSGAGLEWLWSGENVGVGPDVVAIHEAFVASLHHYENIIRSNYDHLGIGVVSNPAGGIYVTHVFAQLGGTTASLPTTPNVAPTASSSAAVPSTPTPAETPDPPAPTPAPPAPIAIEGGIVSPAPSFDVEAANERSSRSPGLVALLRRLLGL